MHLLIIAAMPHQEKSEAHDNSGSNTNIQTLKSWGKSHRATLIHNENTSKFLFSGLISEVTGQ